ncbi:MAG TPA: hypothetical protein VG125_24730 [Pirellulales bacterium]|jgi:hypothetical protein|nr:hypothetical protein [Pirellulales bacterium]
MTAEEALLAVIEALESTGIGYMLVGSLSSNYYGVPRSTHDADFVARLGDQDLRQLLERLGPTFHLDRQMSFETVSMTTRHVLTIASSPFIIELFRLSDDEHDQQRFSRRRRGNVLGRAVWLPTAEDVIVTKVKWALNRASTKDRDDVRGIIAQLSEGLDWTYIYSWADRHGTRQLIDKIRGEIPPIPP